MTALGFLLIFIGIGAVIEGYHSKTLWGALGSVFTPATTAKKQ